MRPILWICPAGPVSSAAGTSRPVNRHTGVTLNFSFASGFTEHSIHIRGSLASATADFERNTYVLHRHTPFGLDFDRHQMVVSEANALKRQARRTFAQVALEKLRPSLGNPYGQSIASALQSFYANLADSTDARLSPELGRDVVRTCLEIGRKSRGRSKPANAARQSSQFNAEHGDAGGESVSPRF